MKHIFFVLFSLVSFNAFAQFVGLNEKEVATLKTVIAKDSSANKFYASLKQTADSALSEMPDPVDTVVSEGHLANHPRKIRTVKSLRDIEKIHALAITYKVDGNKVYLTKAAEYITAWAERNQPQGNPINDTKFENLFFAYDLVRNELPDGQRTTINNWLVKMAEAEINSGQKSRKNSFSNWNSHRLKVIGCIAYILDNEKFKNYIAYALPEQIGKNLLPDGSGIDFHERDALHYHVYTLEPLISLATVVQRATSKDFYHYTSPTGASIKKSIDFLIPFVRGEKIHHEYVNSTVAFDRKRAENKEPGFEIGAPFKGAKGLSLLGQASYFKPDCMDVVRMALHTTSAYPTWQALINVVRLPSAKRINKGHARFRKKTVSKTIV